MPSIFLICCLFKSVQLRLFLYSGHKWLTAAPCHFYAVLALRESELASSHLFCFLIFEYTSVKSKLALVHVWALTAVYNALAECPWDKNHFVDGSEVGDWLMIERARRWINVTKSTPLCRGTRSFVNKIISWGFPSICIGQSMK